MSRPRHRLRRFAAAPALDALRGAGLAALACCALVPAGIQPVAAAEEPPSRGTVLLDKDEAWIRKAAALRKAGVRVLADYGRLVLVEPSGQVQGRLLAGSGLSVRRQLHRGVRLRRRTLTPSGPLSAAPAGGLHAVQFPGPVLPSWLDSLSALQGVRILAPLPEEAYLAWLPPGAGDLLSSLPVPPHVAPVEPSDRISPDLDGASGPTRVALYFVDSPGGRAALEAAEPSWPGSRGAAPSMPGLLGRVVTLAPDQIEEIQRDPHLFWMEPWGEASTHDEVSSLLTAGLISGTGPSGPSYRSWLADLGLDDLSGMIVHIVDTGVDSGLAGVEHPALAGRLLAAFNETAEAEPGDCVGHGTHIAGIIAGNPPAGFDLSDDSGYSYGLGMAPTARLVSSRIFTCAGLFDVGRPFTEIFTDAWNAGARISNNSWGQGGPSYTSLAREFDAIVRDVDGDPDNGEQPMVVVASSGNSGPGLLTMGSPAVAKNVVTVGGTESVRPEGTDGCGAGPDEADNVEEIRSTSSRGPTVDGRSKPDLVAPGSHIVSTVSQAGSYEGFGLCNTFYPPGQHLYTWTSGTSQSAAHVSGAAAVFMEEYRRRHGRLPSPAMVKAGMVATATDLGDPVTPTGAVAFRPSPSQGWGRIDLDALAGRRTRWVLDQTRIFTSPGQELRRGPLQVADPSRPVAVVLAWTDAPGTPAGSSWVNDLDLEVETVSGTFLGNVLEDGFSIPGGAHDERNNVEAVFLPPGAGSGLTVRVTAVSLPGDGVPSAPSPTDQDFALFVSNVLVAEAPGRLQLDRREASCTGSLEAVLTDSGLSGGGRALVAASSPAEPAGEPFQLLESPPSSGIFRGTIPLSTGPAAADGALQVADGQVIVVSYEDDDTGGGSGAVVEETAVARCAPIQISGVRVESVGETTAVVTWSTDRLSDSTVTLESGKVSHDPVPVTEHRVVLTGLPSCTAQDYVITSADASGALARHPAQGSSSFSTGTGRRMPIFLDDLEHFRSGWSHGGAGDEWELGRPQVGPAAAASGLRVWGSDLDGRYAENSDSWLELPPVDLRGLREATLTFRHFVDIPEAVTPGDPQDGAWVEVSIDGGATWIVRRPLGGYPVPAGPGNPHIPAQGGVYAGTSSVWSEARFDLSDLGGGPALVRLRLWRDPSGGSPPGTGWMVDDLRIEGVYPCGRGTLALDSAAYGCGSRVEITLADEDVDRDPGREGLASVIAQSPSGPEGVQLRETGPATGVYTGTLLLSPSPAPGMLQVSQGDRLVVRYQDGDDGTSSAVQVETSAEVADCTAPSPPGSPFLSRGDDGRLQITWTDPPESDLAEIRIHYDSDGPGPSYNGTGAAEGASPLRAERLVGRARLSELPHCQDQFISLTAVDRFGNESGYSTELVGAPFLGTPCPRASIALAGASGAGCSQDVPIRVDDGNADPDPSSPGSIDVTASSSSSPAGLTIPLAETGPDTGAFTGFIPLSASSAAGRLQVSQGDLLEVLYTDADTGAGGPSTSRAAVPVDDCVAPAIMDITRTRLGFNEIGLRWETDEPAESLLEFGLDPGLESSLPGPPDVSEHSVLIPSLPACTTVYFRITATDRRDNATVADDQGFPFHVETSRPFPRLVDDLEGGAPGWSTGGAMNEWELGPPVVGPPPPPSGTTVWGTDLDGRYEAGADLHLTTPEVDLTGLQSASLTFQHWYDIFSSTAGAGFDDGGWVEVSSDGGSTWTYIEPQGGYPDTVAGNPYLVTGTPVYAGTTSGWEEAVFDLGRFAGERVVIRFHLYQDRFDPPHPGLGWYIDDVAVHAAAPCHQGGINLSPGGGSCSGSPLSLQVWDVDADTSPLPDTLTVRLTSPTDPLPLDVTLEETGPSTGEFAAQAPFGSPPPPGGLSVSDGDLITATYDDADDGTGIPASPRATFKVGDCTPPLISGLRWTRLDPARILVEWETDEPATGEIRDAAGATVVTAPGLSTSHSLELGGLSACAVTSFQVASTDSGGNVAVAPGGGSLVSPEGRREIVILEEGFETGGPGWRHGGDPDEWEIGAPQSGPGSAFAGQSVAATGLAGPYSRDRARISHETWLESPPFSLGGLTSASLSLEHDYSFALDTRGDGGIVEILDAGRWRALQPEQGYPGLIRTDRGGGTRPAFVNASGGWVGSSFDLSSYLGRVVRIRLRLHVDHGSPSASDGWYVDEIRVTGTASCSRGVVELDRDLTGCGPGSLGILLSDTDLNADAGSAESATVQLSGQGGSVQVVLSETAADSGVFRGEVGFGPAGSPAAVIAGEGGSLEVLYADADDGSGAPATVSDSAQVSDCRPPRISRVGSLLDGGGTDLVITWETDEPASSRAVLHVPGRPDAEFSLPAHSTAHRILFPGLPPCSPYSVSVESADAAGNVSTAGGASPPFAGESRIYTVHLEDDMEGPSGPWQSAGTVNEWSRGVPLLGPPGPMSGTQVTGTDLSGFYDLGTDARLFSEPLDLTAVTSARLTFWHYFDMFASGTPSADDDGAWVEIRRGSDPVPVYVQPRDGYNNTIDRDAGPPIRGGSGVFAGNSEGWQLSTVDLTPFAGSGIRVQFHVWNDVNEGVFNRKTGTGWYLDDVKVTSPGACFAAPQIDSVAGGALTQGDAGAEIAVTGAGFREPLSLEAGPDLIFQDVAAPTTGRVTARIDVPATAATGAYPLTVINPDGQRARIEGAIVVGPDPSRADLDGSGSVDGRDLALLARAFGTFSGEARYDPAADLDGDGAVDGADLAVLAAAFGRTFTP